LVETSQISFEFLVVAASMAEGEVEGVVALVAVVVPSSMLITSLISEEEDEDTRDGLSTAVVVVVVNDNNVDVYFHMEVTSTFMLGVVISDT
jgi:hypothetical protein